MSKKKKPNIPDKAPKVKADIELDGQVIVQNPSGHQELARVDKDGKTKRTFNEKLSKILEANTRRDFLKKSGAAAAAAATGDVSKLGKAAPK